MSQRVYHFFFFLISLILLLSLTSSQEYQYKYYKYMDYGGNFILGWKYNATHIEFQATVKTVGYVGFGISKMGEMFDADIVMGWVAANPTTFQQELYFADYHTNSSSRTPMMDRKQDWSVTSGTENNGTTVLEFVRKLDTCDLNDIAITKDTLRLIWSYALEDPDAKNGMVPYHGREMRGSIEISLLESDAVPQSYPPPQTYTLQLKNHNFSIPANGSSLQCIVFDLKGVVPKSNIIKFAPEVTPGNEAYVYRMVLYRCNIDNPDLAGSRFHCEDEAPVAVKSCKSIVASWSMGGESFHFPDDVGIPMGGPADPSTYVIEIHYSKFKEIPNDVPDYSGLVLTYTQTNLTNKAAMLEVGKVVSPGWKQFIPDGEPAFTTTSYCSPRCMSWGFDGKDKQIQIIGVMFKGNDVTREVKLRHIRGNEELEVISADKKFSNFYQAPRLLNKPITVQDTDSLAVECTFNTTSRAAVTRGGWSRVSEVCRATLVYYPAKPFDLCLSWSSLDQLMTKDRKKVPEKEAVKHLTGIANWDATDKRLFKKALATSNERSICSSVLRTPAFAIDRYKPNITKWFQEMPKC